VSSLTRVAIISVVPAKDVSNEKLQAELQRRLRSKLFSVEKIAILDEQYERPIPSPSTKQK
jgi:hypothetical protein